MLFKNSISGLCAFIARINLASLAFHHLLLYAFFSSHSFIFLKFFLFRLNNLLSFLQTWSYTNFYALIWPDWMRFYPLGLLCRLPIYCSFLTRIINFTEKFIQLKIVRLNRSWDYHCIDVLQQKHTYSIYNRDQ
jgi:hypothetical protein